MSSGKRPDLSSSSHDIEIGGPSETDSLLGKGRTKMTRFFHGFVDFAFQGNILQIAFGLIVAAAFTDLVKSFVSAILMPPIAIILPINKNIEEKFAVLRAGPNYNSSSPSGGYNTLNQAQSDGAVVMAYGSFIYQMVSFVMVGFSFLAGVLIAAAGSTAEKICRNPNSENLQRVIHDSWKSS
ncbi:large conductance mechanosensitive channel [Trichoderma gamsii]|uniref:Large conductance mechanosensitive channel n=1 Tax=Trichoderma gamsii TaxID=398673 RepID=A0A2P4ZAQ6_9HYPO|nr:large conductance mechanosensitive channel [Trichoderma gamsii]PON21375.1 large conductance mechanosensitive channel [Trichoderma gamsii]